MPPIKPNPPAPESTDPDLHEVAQTLLHQATLAEKDDAAVYLRLSTQASAAAANVASDHPYLHLRTLVELGNAQRICGELGDALGTFEQAIRLCQDLVDERVDALLGLAYHRTGIVYDIMGNPAAAVERLRMALVHYHQSENDEGRSRVENSLGVVYSRSADYEQALGFFESSLRNAEAMADRARMSSSLSNISITTRLLGRIEESVEAAERSLGWADHLDSQASCTTNLALSLAMANRMSEAEAAFERGLAMHEALGDPSCLAEHLQCHADFLFQTERPRLALPMLERSLELAEGIEALHQVQGAHERLYLYWKEQGDHQAALIHHEAFHQTSKRLDMDAAARELRHQKWQQQVERAKLEAAAERKVRERLAISYAELAEIHRGLSAQTVELQRQSRHDGLTGLANRQHFDERVALEVDLAAVQAAPAAGSEDELGLVLLDLDSFKSINDRFGHPVGDQVLKQVAGLLQDSVRGSDLCGRLGGEEFGVLLTRTGAAGVAGVANKVRRLIAEHGWERLAPGLKVTTSVGGALLSESDGSTQSLFSLADARLYQAKHGGRDRVVTRAEESVKQPG